MSKQTPYLPLLGNGEVLCAFSDSDLVGIRFGYSLPSLFSLYLSFPESPVEHIRRFERGMLLHKFVFQGGKTCLVSDSLPNEKTVYVRKIVSDIPIELTVSSPAYAECTRLWGYPVGAHEMDLFSFYAPCGLPLGEDLYSKESSSAFLFAKGNAVLTPSGKISVSKGETTLFAIGGKEDTLEALCKEALALALPTPSAASPLFDGDVPLIDILPPIAGQALLSHQAKSGAFALSFEKPFAASEAIPFYVEALLSINEPTRAKACLSFWLDFYRQKGSLPSCVGLSGDCARSKPTASGALMLAKAILIYCENTADKAFFKTQKDTLTALCKQKSLTFTDADRLLYLCRHRFEDFLPLALLYADTAEKLLRLASRFRTPLSPEDKAYLVSLTDIATVKRFSAGKRKAPLLFAPSTHADRPRFTEGICPACRAERPFPAVRLLEKVSLEPSLYLCHACRVRYGEEDALPALVKRLDEAERAFSPYAAMLALLSAALSPSGRRAFGKARLAELLESLPYTLYEEQSVTFAATLSAASILSPSLKAKLIKKLGAETQNNGIPAARRQDGMPLIASPCSLSLAMIATALSSQDTTTSKNEVIL